MRCQHDEYELTAENLGEVENGFNVIYQHFVCSGCGEIGERTYRMPVEITWNGNQTKLDFE